MNKVIQSEASAQGDIVGRDKTTNNFIAPPSKTLVEKLLIKLQKQIDNNEHARSTIDELARYHTRRSIDGIEGLQAKLEAANKTDIYIEAIEKKEMFAKLLDHWSLYSSAQQIFSHILAKAENEFNQVIYPEIPQHSEADINSMVLTRIVNPIVEECGGDVMLLNSNVVLGMVYWLAEQCFIRWHHEAVS